MMLESSIILSEAVAIAVWVIWWSSGIGRLSRALVAFFVGVGGIVAGVAGIVLKTHVVGDGFGYWPLIYLGALAVWLAGGCIFIFAILRSIDRQRKSRMQGSIAQGSKT
jgi:hypothetical protein